MINFGRRKSSPGLFFVFFLAFLVFSFSCLKSNQHAKQKISQNLVQVLGGLTNAWVEKYGRLPTEDEFWKEVFQANLPALKKINPKLQQGNLVGGWGEAVVFCVLEQDTFQIASFGRNGKRDYQENKVFLEARETTCFENDIIWQNDLFVQSRKQDIQRVCE